MRYDIEPANLQACLEAAKEFRKTAIGKLIVHISDTDTKYYPFIAALLEAVGPALTIHTGDMADEYKAGRKPEDVPGYMRVVPELLDIMRRSSSEVWVVKGNNDRLEVLEGSGIAVKPNGCRTQALGITMELDHVAIPAAFGVDFAIYGHGPTDDLRYPLEDIPGDTVYLNGNYFWSIIDSATKRFIRLPYRAPVLTQRILIVRHGQT